MLLYITHSVFRPLLLPTFPVLRVRIYSSGGGREPIVGVWF
ncbi:unnamed protein product [Brassica oleracea var. botrytis]